MSCLNIRHHISRASHKCLQLIGVEAKHPTRKALEISAPFDFKEGPAVLFPGFSESEISLMKEKAIASTAVAPAEEDQSETYSLAASSRHSCGFPLSHHQVYGGRISAYGLVHAKGHSRAGSQSSMLRRRVHGVVDHARKVSKGCLH